MPAIRSRERDDWTTPADFVCIEAAAALKRGVPVVPVLLDGTPPPHPTEVAITVWNS